MSLDVTWLGTKFPSLLKLAPLGQGGQKWVFSADHPNDGAVVLKLIQPRMSMDLVTREIAAVRQVASPRVPEILETGVIDTPLGQCFWFRERRIDGHSVEDSLKRGPFDANLLPPSDSPAAGGLLSVRGLESRWRPRRTQRLLRCAG
jgi:serine/threonine-protein kinase